MAGRGRCGRGGLAQELDELGRAGLSAALDAGEAILAAGGNALDAVEAAARVLEEDPCFNAGRGSVLAYDGHVELDAAIMDGRDRRCGAVAGLRSTRAPISAARAVMEQSPHVLMSYEGADDFACEAGLEQVPNRWFVTPERRRQLDELLARGSASIRRRHQIWNDRRGCGRPPWPCRVGHVDRRPDRQALGTDRRFSADRRRHLCRRPRCGGQRDRTRRSLHPGRRSA